jgi:CDP-paratose 2-epimerase
VKWLITGGCGFVGSNLADTLLGQGEDVVVLDNLSRIGSAANLTWLQLRHGSNWRFVEADVRDADLVEDLVAKEKPGAIAHLAGQVAMTTSLQDPRADFETNALGSLNILEAARRKSPGTAVLYSSTNKVYGDLEWIRYSETASRYVAEDYPNGFDETLPLNFHSPYGCSKGAADQYMLDYARMYEVQSVVFRHSSMYGGRQFATADQGWVGWFCQEAVDRARRRTDAPITISGTGKQVRDILHADDLIRCYVEAVEHLPKVAGRVFNIGGGMENSLSLLELFSLLEEIVGTKLEHHQRPWRESDQKVFVANNEAATRLFGWQPTVAAPVGVRMMVGWISELMDGSVEQVVTI